MTAQPDSAQPAPPGAASHYVALDGMRGLLAFGVMLFHLGFNSIAERALGWHGLSFRTAVDVFFLLSGFVLTYSVRRGFDGRVFAVKRVFRLLPVYLAATALIPLAAGGAVPLADWPLLSPFLGRELVNGPAWSVCAELFVPLLAAIWPQRLPDRLVWPLLVVVVAGLGVLAVPLADADGNHLLRGALGLLGGHLLYRTGADLRVPFVAVVAALLAAMSAAMYVHALAVLIPALACAAILCGRHHRGVMNSAPFRWLGTISYTVYLAHWPVMQVFQHRLGDGFGHNPPAKLAAGVISVALAVLLTFAVERPFMRLGARAARWVAQPRQATPGVAALPDSP